MISYYAGYSQSHTYHNLTKMDLRQVPFGFWSRRISPYRQRNGHAYIKLSFFFNASLSHSLSLFLSLSFDLLSCIFIALSTAKPYSTDFRWATSFRMLATGRNWNSTSYVSLIVLLLPLWRVTVRLDQCHISHQAD